MKKFLLTSLAALFAVVSFAQFKVTKQVVTPMNETTPVSRVLDRQPVAKNVKAPQSKNVFAKKALRRAAIGSIDELQGEFIVCNNEFSYDSEAQKLVSAPISRKGISANIEVTGENTIAIYGIDGNASETSITATVDIVNSTISIAPGQLIWTYEDEESGEKTDFVMANAESETGTDPITGKIYEGGIIVLDQLWYESYTEEGKSYRNGYFKGTSIAVANGVMEFGDKDKDGNVSVVAQNVLVVQDPETKVATVWNFHNFVKGQVVEIPINHDKSFLIESDTQLMYISGENYIYLWGFDGKYITDVTGTVNEDKLISNVGLAYIYTSGGRRGWLLPEAQFTITLTDGSQFALPDLEEGELVTPPAGLVTKEYPLSVATWYDENGAQGAYEATVKIGVVDSDVYFQGIDKDLPEAWVKGVLNATKDTIVVPVTYTGAFNDAAHFIGAYSKTGPSELKLVYDADADTYEYGATVMCYKGSKSSSFNYYMNGMFIGVKPAPTAVPDGLETVEMPFKGNYRSDEDDEAYELEGTVNVGWDGNDLYIQNLFSIVEDGWIKGTRNGNKIVFAKNQYIGNLSNSLSCYLTGYDSEAKAVSDVVFTYNENDNYFVADMPVIATRFKSSTKYEAFFAKGLVIGTDPAAGISTVKAEKAGSGIIYNLAGQRVGKEYKGLVIKNGRKLVNK